MMNGNAKYRFLNPYNFVRYLSEGISGDTPEIKLLGRCTPPPHDRFIGLTGKIKCVLETITPLFISDSEFVGNRESEHRSYRFFRLKNDRGEEKFAIPSTSLRGMLRSVFEAVTNSCFSVFEGEKRLSYHLQPKESKKLVPGRIEKRKNGQWVLRLLTGTTHYKPNGPDGNNYLYSAWIKMYSPLNPNKTERQNPHSPYSKRSQVHIPEDLHHGDKCFALLERMEHPPRRNRKGGRFYFWNVKAISKRREALPQPRQGERIEEGFLCINYQNIENKHDERFFFKARENRSLPDTIHIDNHIIERYCSLIEDYKSRHKDDIEQARKKGFDPSVAENGKSAYSRFILEDRESLEGELVYVMLEKRQKNSFSVKFIVPASVPRVGYENTIGSLLPKHLHPCSNYDFLCPACRLFGWVHPDPSEDPSDKVAYAGRVRISYGKIVKDNGTLDGFSLAILSTPKPTTTFFYLFDRNKRPSFNVKYDDEGAMIRGRKFYRHQNEANPQEYRRRKKDNQNRTIRDALRPGAKFTFTIEFENLAPIELGALLWTIELEDGMFHKLGMGKPLGFGSVKISIEEVKVLNTKERYRSYTEEGYKEISDTQKTKWINLFKRSMKNKYGNTFDELENVKDLKAILSCARLPIHYPRTTENPTKEGKNFEWFMKNKRRGEMPLELADGDRGFPLQF